MKELTIAFIIVSEANQLDAATLPLLVVASGTKQSRGSWRVRPD
jgi:hypothetical protein